MDNFHTDISQIWKRKELILNFAFQATGYSELTLELIKYAHKEARTFPFHSVHSIVQRVLVIPLVEILELKISND